MSKDSICTKTYDRFCAQLDHEDELISNRINWLLASQSLLFGALKFGQGPDTVSNVIICVGLFSSLIIGISTLAAVLAYRRYRKQLKNAFESANGAKKCFPQLNRDPCIMCMGFLSAIFLPLLFTLAWSYMLCKETGCISSLSIWFGQPPPIE